ncbi:hypothetical protein [Edaphobacter bradus]|uniref:hypothetical protein n=1 Tax=Edaphobacter bradus TaxID=2259016 RepID=UPI0021E0E44A|nr:hypothetical protein [Edaphobacter bradus]
MDDLLAGRKNDQLAMLERLYVRSGEVLHRLPYGETSPELRRYRDELYDLRSGWRRDIERILETAKDPAVNSWWNHQILKLGFKWSPERLVIDFFEDKVRASREKELLSI